ncbi:MAG: hypothetical protein JRE64_22765 [Deltaproteobacteria bacterium]|nr:hypothetical protein [Deltaproteobacteria bacterium]
MVDKKVKTIGLIASLCVACIIILFFIKHEILFEVSLLPDTQNGIRFSNKNWVVKPDTDGFVHFNLMGALENRNIRKVMMKISPDEEHKWYLQGNGYKVSDGVFIGKIQLGSREYPMKKDQHCTFRLTRNNGELLAQGEVDAQVYKIYGTDSLMLIFVTFLASVIQIFSFVLSFREKK